MLRLLCLLLALPALVVGALGLAAGGLPEQAAVQAALGAAAGAIEAIGLDPEATLGRVSSPLVGGGLLLGGLLLLLPVLRGRAVEPEPAEEGEAEIGETRGERRALRRAGREAARRAKQGDLAGAAELCLEGGLLDEAAGYFEQAEEWVRAAEIRHDQNRFSESAELYARAGQFDTAGTIYGARGEPARAADCYEKAGRMSVAAEMYEKAGSFRRAGDCYAHCEFHRQAAEAFVRAEVWDRAAASLDAVVREEGARRVADPGQLRELERMVKRAGELYARAGDLASAVDVLERGDCFAEAAEVAGRLDEHERAAELFLRAGDAKRAAEALRRVGEEARAAQILGEHHRDRGEPEEAARLLTQAGDFAGAGDLYRNLEDYKMAAECYERQGDSGQAAAMFRLAGEHARALESHERVGQWVEAAECAALLGDAAREAACLEQAGLLLRAGEVFAGHGLEDDAIRVLQQVTGPAADAAAAAALLGRLFVARGKHGLAIARLRQVLGDAGEAEVDATTIDLHYALAIALEAEGQMREAAALYERIQAADYHYEDVEVRLERTRAQARELRELSGVGGPAAGEGGDESGRYRIVSELGRGGMGIVYKAQDTVLDRPVAFKVLPDALRDSPQAMRNFLREAKSAAKLNHPNIVTVYDAGEQQGRFYIAMEYVDGTTLKEIVRRRGVISPMGALTVLLQMCDALAFAHRHKVVHRDIKTANTMWTRDRKAKIMDFGLAKVVEEVRNHTTLVSGTPFYMSPEQTLGRNVDHRTDIYSLGVTLFELVTGTLPFKEGNVPYHHVHTPPPDPLSVNPRLPRLLVQVIARCLEKDPERRFQSAGEIAAVVRPALARAARKP